MSAQDDPRGHARLELLSFNTAIARMMEFVNYFTKQSVRPRAAMETLVLLLSPLAPHIAEELWQCLGHAKTLAYEPWPEFDEALTVDATIEIPVQIKGKVALPDSRCPRCRAAKIWKQPPARMKRSLNCWKDSRS